MRTQSRHARTDEDLSVTLLIAGYAAAVTVTHWLAANLAALVGRGRLLGVNPTASLAALSRLPTHAGDPRLAWNEPARSNLPGPIIYWLTLAPLVVIGVVLATVANQRFQSQRHEPPDKRRRLGVETQARLATTRDLRPLLTRGPEPGRFVLARWGRRLLSTEEAGQRGRRGVRGAIAVFGPSQSGKTTGLVDGVGAWEGPGACQGL